MSVEQQQTLKFICLVEDRPALWQKQHRDFMNRDIRIKLFEELSELCGLSEEMCRKKLKNLKDKMRDICNKLPKTKSGHPAFEKGAQIVRWPFYHAMLFMKEEFMGRETLSGATSQMSEEEYPQEYARSTFEDSEEEVSNESSSVPQSDVHALAAQRQTRPKPRTCKKARLDDDFGSVEKEKFDEARDEWDAFCASVAFDLRKLKDPFLKMRVKGNINRVVNEAVLEQLQKDAQPTTTVSASAASYSVPQFQPKYEV